MRLLHDLKNNMRVNNDEVIFNTEFAPKNFGSITFLRFQGVGITSAKGKNLFLIRGIIFFKVYSVN